MEKLEGFYVIKAGDGSYVQDRTLTTEPSIETELWLTEALIYPTKKEAEEIVQSLSNLGIEELSIEYVPDFALTEGASKALKFLNHPNVEQRMIFALGYLWQITEKSKGRVQSADIDIFSGADLEHPVLREFFEGLSRVTKEHTVSHLIQEKSEAYILNFTLGTSGSID